LTKHSFFVLAEKFSRLMQPMPVKVILNDQAARYALEGARLV